MKSMLFLLTLAAASCFALSKSAADYFHDAANKYIADRHQEASVEADEGLSAYPGDPQLQMLSDLLKQMKDQQRQDQNQGGGSQNKPNPNNKNDQNKNQQNKDRQNKDQNKNPNQNGQNKNNPNGQNPQDKQQPPQDKSGQGKDQKSQQQPPQQNPQNGADSAGKAQDSLGQGGQPRRPGQMSKEDAERLLNSFIDEEKQAQQSRLGTPHKPAAGGQNW